MKVYVVMAVSRDYDQIMSIHSDQDKAKERVEYYTHNGLRLYTYYVDPWDVEE